MTPELPNVVLEDGINLSEVLTTGSILNISECYNEIEDASKIENRHVNSIGEPVKDFKAIENALVAITKCGYVKKKILEEGGGLPLNEECTVTIAYSGYWENEMEPFDVAAIYKPLEVDLKDHGLLPGLDMAIKSMLVGEKSLFLLSYKVMYGELGVPPRIKPKVNCVFYIKLISSIITPKIGKIKFSEPNMFERVLHEAKMLYTSGVTLHKAKNFSAAIQLFRKAIDMLHKCRLADEKEEKIQEKMLVKLYSNLTICYNNNKQPLKACTACNELNRLDNLWNNGKMLYQNAKSFRMIGQFNKAEKRLNKAMKLCSNNDEIRAELELLKKSRHFYEKTKSIVKHVMGPSKDLVSREFQQEIDNLIKTFKHNMDLSKLTLPGGLNSAEVAYVKNICIRENLFFNEVRNYDVDVSSSDDTKSQDNSEKNYVLDKEEQNIDKEQEEIGKENEIDLILF